jgi:uncharacterized alpha-E superfamily protein
VRDPGKGNAAGAALHSVERIQRLLVTWEATSQASRTNSAKVAAEALQSAEKFGSALSLLRSAQRTATSLRERLSPDAWQVITEMVERLGVEADDDDGVVSAAELSLQELASFAGLAQENMNRAAGWRFLDMGRRAERAINTARFARQFAYDEAGDEDLDVLLTLVDCQITYRSRYLVGPVLAPVRDLAVLDPYNPRSVAFQVNALNEHIAELPSLKEHGLIERPQRLAVAAQAMLATAEATTLDAKTQLESAGYTSTALGGPLEDGTYTLDMTGATDCMLQVTASPTGGLTTVNGGALPVTGNDGYSVVAYLADTDGSGDYPMYSSKAITRRSRSFSRQCRLRPSPAAHASSSNTSASRSARPGVLPCHPAANPRDDRASSIASRRNSRFWRCRSRFVALGTAGQSTDHYSGPSVGGPRRYHQVP